MKKLLFLFLSLSLIMACSNDKHGCGTYKGKPVYKTSKGECYYIASKGKKEYVESYYYDCESVAILD